MEDNFSRDPGRAEEREDGHGIRSWDQVMGSGVHILCTLCLLLLQQLHLRVLVIRSLRLGTPGLDRAAVFKGERNREQR